MAQLYLHGRSISSVFQLLGDRENDMSYSLSWALTQCPSFLCEFTKHILGSQVRVEGVEVRLQQHESRGGITDIEIESLGRFYFIMEAKRGWRLPRRKQLEKYASRESFIASKARKKILVILSECSREYVGSKLGFKNVNGVPVDSVSWKDMARFATRAKVTAPRAGKLLLEELLIYLRRLMVMQNVDSNLVYVAAISDKTKPGWGISWKDIVEKRHLYFHPIGGSYPKEPPNYVAFRYDGELQSIHHIESYEVVTNLHMRLPEIPDGEVRPRFLYKLGPGFRPRTKVPSGRKGKRLYRNAPAWCMLDTLFTCKSIADAWDLSNKRKLQKAR